METKMYVGYVLTKILESEDAGWESQILDIVSECMTVQDIEDLDQVTNWLEVFDFHYNFLAVALSNKAFFEFVDIYNQLKVRQKKLEYIYFCCDNELPEHYYSSLQKFKAYENS